MSTKALKSMFEESLQKAGIAINGENPWDLQVKDERFYDRVLREGRLGLGESYMDGWWDCEQLDELAHCGLKSGIEQMFGAKWKLAWLFLKATLFNLQSKRRAYIVGKHHYDIGNDLFKLMLDKRMTYSCAYWKNAATLDEAQEAKLELICQKIQLKPGMRVLDIGCGWGSFAKYAAEKYQAKVVGITISENQIELARDLCKDLPIEIRLQDYREVNEKFDRIVSVGQMEHVGYKNYRTYMLMARRCLNKEGLFLLHTIGTDISYTYGDPWLQKYIFPNGMLPSIKQLAHAAEGLFVMEDLHNFGADYDKTLMAWYNNFNHHYGELRQRYDERFYRMWKFYLLGCAGLFRARLIQLWQIVFSPHGVPRGYISVR